ncbi:splicing factor YJU2 isoform X2 [Punica granatum]|uniref:Splicing factor YJU2 n=2 Tax=Punica granatum TaxID=22663 RepID=A0A6P8EHZ1_PUNGR|nr:splicing factor YJU2 isoform X2 [Punica granatum]
MGERKVLNKYYPPDFDPSKLPRVRRDKNQQIKVRMMLPMSIRCNTCGNYIYKGTKFNSRKEDVEGEKYLGIQIFRFYFKCTRCSAELTMKTDPKNSDYVVESGATRNFEPWRAEDEEEDNVKRKREAEEMGDAMKSLENRTLDSKREMDILAALDEMKSMKSRHATVSLDEMLAALQRSSADKEKKLEDEDEALIKSIVFHGSKDFVRRIEEDGDSEDDGDQAEPSGESHGDSSKKRKISQEFSANPTDSLTKASVNDSIDDNSSNKGNPNGSRDNGDTKFVFGSSTVRVSVVKKPAPTSAQNDSAKVEESKKDGVDKLVSAESGLLSLCQSYGSDDDDDEQKAKFLIRSGSGSGSGLEGMTLSVLYIEDLVK